MKRLAVATICALALAFSFVSNSYAVTDSTYGYMTETDTSTSPKTTPYSLTQIPYLYWHIPNTENISIQDVLFWFNDYSVFTESFSLAQRVVNATSQDIWISPLSSEWLGGLAREGDWGAYAKIKSEDNRSLFAAGCKPFSVVPEPVSTVLFILGGATLAAQRIRRKK